MNFFKDEGDFKMLLSIGMIVKNEEKYLRDCLNGIKPILEQVSSELIICDTGSSDSTIEIAKEFTNKVYEIEWRDDFAWARQQTLKRARGKWFMYIDADEIFQDTTDLISFFNSGEYKKYGRANFKLRNLLDKGERFQIFNALRLLKLTKESRFNGIIHEHILPQFNPNKDLESWAVHHGYIFESEFDKRKKARRNLAPMLKIYEDNPSDLRNILHLIQHHGLFMELEEATKWINIGLNSPNCNHSNIFYHAIIQASIAINNGLNDHTKILEIINEYFNNGPIVHANAVYIQMSEAYSLEILKRYKESADAAVKTFTLMERVEQGELSTEILTIASVPNVGRDDILRTVIGNYMISGAFELAHEWLLKLVDVDSVKFVDMYSIFVNHAIKETPQDVSKLYDYVVAKYGIGTKEYDNAISAIERNISNPKEKIAVVQSLLTNRVDCGDGYIRLQNLRKLDFENDPAVQDELSLLVNSNESFPQHFGDVLVIAMKYNADFVSIVDKIQITNNNEFMMGISRSNNDLENVLLEYIKSNNFIEACTSIKAIRLMSGMLAVFTEFMPVMDMMQSEEVRNEKYLTIFEAYIRLRHKYLTLTYRDEVYCAEQIKSLTEQDGFVFYVGRAYECKDAGDIASAAKNLRLSLTILPDKKDIVSLIGDKLKEESSAPSIQDQLNEQTGRLKSIIYTMINTGNIAQAAQILESYEQANPTDPEIGKIKEMVKVS